MFQSIGYPVFIYGGCHVVGHSFDMGLGISHSYPCGYVFQHGDIVAAVTESHCVFQVNVKICQHFVYSRTFTVAPCNDIGKQWILAHRFAMSQHFAEYICFFFLFGRKVSHYLQDIFSTGFFYGGDRGNRNFNQIGNSLYSVIHFSDEHFIAVYKNERYRIFLLKSY